jgi:hypothetical protein
VFFAIGSALFIVAAKPDDVRAVRADYISARHEGKLIKRDAAQSLSFGLRCPMIL